MQHKRLMSAGRAVALASMLSLMAASGALADSSSLNDTGPSSNNQVTQSNSNSVSSTNVNVLHVDNDNSQTAASGSANVSGNTNGGSANSGSATNSNNTSTSISVGNSAPNVLGLGGGSAGSGGGTGSGAGAGSGSAPGSGSGSLGSGAGLGSGSAAVLPATGCSITCDVSALRAAYKPFGGATAQALQQAKGVSAGLLALAALLSLVGAGGSAIYATRKVKA